MFDVIYFSVLSITKNNPSPPKIGYKEEFICLATSWAW